jgi:hypothetical protein
MLLKQQDYSHGISPDGFKRFERYLGNLKSILSIQIVTPSSYPKGYEISPVVQQLHPLNGESSSIVHQGYGFRSTISRLHVKKYCWSPLFFGGLLKSLAKKAQRLEITISRSGSYAEN